jgi:hypothetical protein
MRAVSAASCRSARRTSGRRRSRSEGSPIGTAAAAAAARLERGKFGYEFAGLLTEQDRERIHGCPLCGFERRNRRLHTRQARPPTS